MRNLWFRVSKCRDRAYDYDDDFQRCGHQALAKSWFRVSGLWGSGASDLKLQLHPRKPLSYLKPQLPSANLNDPLIA